MVERSPAPGRRRADFLARVCREAVERVVADQAAKPMEQVRDEAAAAPAPPSFSAALGADDLAVIAEVKRASPSRGHMADILDPAALAEAYRAGGASAISVLTEPAHFRGTLHDLTRVTAAVSLPVIRKDFIVDAYQLWQARASGAAAALLIVAALSPEQLADLMGAAHRAGLDVLVETHDAEEVRIAVGAHAQAATGRRLVMGINARNLVTLEVDRAQVARVRKAVDLPESTILVAESGIRGPEDVRAYAEVGADAVLVGEHVATASDPQAAVRALTGIPVVR